MPITEAFTGIRNVRVKSWELWPQRKSLDGQTWLCRWCAKPLSGQRTSYCSDACEKEIAIRGSIPATRRFAIERANGLCEGCGLNLTDLEQAFDWYDKWYYSIPFSNRQPRHIGSYKDGMDPWAWPSTPRQFRTASGFKSYGHVWEVNHKISIAEGGDPVDPSNLEVLCLPCHRKHTKNVAGRLAEKRKTK